ncbi:erythromycin esterase family protein [Pedobacter frigoris]|uniref:erythromycin esterase family protein n=1 Tax=Pedobacter frigoris TaxID=2571272 RepID=UPI002931A78C|nr:erythromycin esterase family protein [Pedobacter frigoris]
MKLSLIFFAILISFITSDKGIRGHVKANLHIVRSINPEDSSFEDLFEIGNAIGDAKLVLLGEQCHGDGATFAAKSRLIKYLHEKKGFNVLAFEADFFTLNDSQDQRRGINTIWSEAEECSDLLNNYIPTTNLTDAPIVISGIDNQFYGQVGSNRLKDFLKTAAKSDLFDKDISSIMDEDFYSSWDSLKSSLIKNQEQLLNPSASYLSLLDKYDTSLSILLSSATKKSNSFGFQVIKNIQAFNNQVQDFKDVIACRNSVRDSMMAENIHWLMSNKFKNQKMIVWAANGHISKQPFSISLVHPCHTMGSFLEPKFRKEDIYTIGFTSRGGEHGIFRTIKLRKPLASNMESWIPDEINYAFLDLKKRPDLANESFTMRVFGHGNLKMNWQPKFDGIFYIKEMYQSNRFTK